MSNEMKRIEGDLMAARKAGDKPLVAVLGMLISKIRLLAKNDGNRDVTDSDVLSSVSKTVKEVNETRDALIKGGRSTEDADYEINAVKVYLPRQLSDGELNSVIHAYLAMAPEGKAARGFVMKQLSTEHRGAFDPAKAQEILGGLIK